MRPPFLRPRWIVAMAVLAVALLGTGAAQANATPLTTNSLDRAQRTAPPPRISLTFGNWTRSDDATVSLIDRGREPGRIEAETMADPVTGTQSTSDVATRVSSSPATAAADTDPSPGHRTSANSADASFGGNRSSAPASPDPTSPAQESPTPTHEEPPQPGRDEADDDGTPWWMLLVGLGLALPLGAGIAATMVNDRARAPRTTDQAGP